MDSVRRMYKPTVCAHGLHSTLEHIVHEADDIIRLEEAIPGAISRRRIGKRSATARITLEDTVHQTDDVGGTDHTVAIKVPSTVVPLDLAAGNKHGRVLVGGNLIIDDERCVV